MVLPTVAVPPGGMEGEGGAEKECCEALAATPVGVILRDIETVSRLGREGVGMEGLPLERNEGVAMAEGVALGVGVTPPLLLLPLGVTERVEAGVSEGLRMGEDVREAEGVVDGEDLSSGDRDTLGLAVPVRDTLGEEEVEGEREGLEERVLFALTLAVKVPCCCSPAVGLGLREKEGTAEEEVLPVEAEVAVAPPPQGPRCGGERVGGALPLLTPPPTPHPVAVTGAVPKGVVLKVAWGSSVAPGVVEGVEVRPALREGGKVCKGVTLGTEERVGASTVMVGESVPSHPLCVTLALPARRVGEGKLEGETEEVALLEPPFGREPLGTALGVGKGDWEMGGVPVKVPLWLADAVFIPPEGVALLPPLPPAVGVPAPPDMGLDVVLFHGEGLGDGEAVGATAVALPSRT